jgi:hypothetical protein
MKVKTVPAPTTHTCHGSNPAASSPEPQQQRCSWPRLYWALPSSPPRHCNCYRACPLPQPPLRQVRSVQPRHTCRCRSSHVPSSHASLTAAGSFRFRRSPSLPHSPALVFTVYHVGYSLNTGALSPRRPQCPTCDAFKMVLTPHAMHEMSFKIGVASLDRFAGLNPYQTSSTPSIEV